MLCPLIKALSDDNEYCQSQRCDCDNCELGKQLVKLSEYEDLEEQGLLLRLPCKVGDIVYSLEFGEIKEHVVTAFKILEGGIFAYYRHLHIGVLGVSVFATKAEAEKALAEMG